MTWQALTLPVPPALTTLTTGVSTGLGALKDALTALKAAAALQQARVHDVNSATVLATSQALQGVVRALTAALDAALDTTGVYVLVVPLPKKGLVRILATPDSADEAGSSYLQFPANAVLAELPEADQARLRSSGTWGRIFNPTELFVGGNAHFVKTLAEALHDAGDNNRPRFEAASLWAYALLVTGASDLAGVLTGATFLNTLFNQGRDANGLGATRGVASLVPTNVRVTASGRALGAVLEWDPVVPRVTLGSYDDDQVSAVEYAVIRSEKLQAHAAMKVTDLFPVGPLAEGQTGLYVSTVLAVRAYDGVTTRYLDATPVAGTTYYYHVAFRTQVNRPKGSASPVPLRPGVPPLEGVSETVQLPWDKLGGGVEFRLPSHPSEGQSQPGGALPDWTRSPSIARVFPPLNQVLDQVQEELRTLGQSSLTVSARDQAYLAFLDREIARYTTQVSAFQGFVGQLQSLFNAPKAGIFATVNEGKGGVGAFLASVSTAFDDPADINRPTFDNGDEYVCGAVLLAVGPDPAPIRAALATLLAIFQPTPDTTSALAGIQSVRTQLVAVEQALIAQLTGGGETPGPETFGADMSPGPAAECAPTEPTPPPTFNDDGTPRS